jgi:hypothetical protein
VEYEPSKFQQAIFDFIRNSKRHLVVDAGPGAGKCLGENTPVLMYDGMIKRVQDIVVGDMVMGPDSKPRVVISTTSGIDNLYEIVPIKGDRFVCNSVHVLTLVHSITGEIYDVPLNELNTRFTKKHVEKLKLFRTGVEYSKCESDLPFDPYLVGVWLGDGTVGEPTITNANGIIVDELDKIVSEQIPECKLAAKWYEKMNSNNIRITLKEVKGNGKPHNRFRRFVKSSLYINNEKRIPHSYLISSRENRLRLLAGILDTDGSLGKGYFEITTKYNGFSQDILHLARGLGFAAYSKEKIATIKSLNFSGKYFRISICGHVNKIPTLVKIANERKQIKNVQRTGFSVKSIGKGKYYGFELAGTDGRFLLGDFTVTHNTASLVEISKIVKEISPDSAAIFLAFNVSIAKELEKKLEGFKAKTINSLFFSYYMKHMGFVKADKNKYWNIVYALMDAMNIDDENGEIAKGIEKFVRIVRATITDIDDQIALREIIDIYDVDYVPWLHDAYKAIMEYGMISGKNTNKTILEAVAKSSDLAKGIHYFFAKKNRFPCIDFTDQLWIPFHSGWIVPEFDIILCDELQDLNNLQFEAIRKAMKSDGRFVGVGDQMQALYLFAGSASDGMTAIADKLDAKILPLSVVYRCPTKHLEVARKINPDLESPEWAQEGILESHKYEGIVPKIGDIGSRYNGSTLVVCRRNAPLLALAYSMLAYRIPFVLKGRDFGRSIQRVIEQIALDKSKKKVREDFEWASFPNHLFAWKMRQMKMLEAKGADESLYISLGDKCDSIEILYQNSMSNDPFEFIDEIKAMFPEEKDSNDTITLCSIHKAKGLERESVFVLEYDRLPFSWKGMSEQQSIQETNMKLVAVTRSKHYMAFISSPEKEEE